MKTVRFRPFFLNGAERVAVDFELDRELHQKIRGINGIRWSQTERCWYLPMNKELCHQAFTELKSFAFIEIDELRIYLEKRKLAYSGLVTSPTAARKAVPLAAVRVSVGNLKQLEVFVRQLKLKAYSDATIRTYRYEFLQLLQLLKNKPVEGLTPDDLKRYLVFAMEKQGISEHSAHSRLNALKFYYEQVLSREKFFLDIPRPRRPQQLPRLLNENEIARLFNALENKKHKAMLFTIYSAGLRVSELVNLKIADIDSRRMQIFVQRAKGKKDRYVNLSPVLLDILRSYVRAYQPGPKVFLFESERTLLRYPVRTVQQIFSNAKKKAGIRKEVGIHSLRHSFATHLLDKGTDIK